MRYAFTIKELLVVMFIISASLFILAPAIYDGHRPARRIQCQNNLKQLILAMHNYHDTFGHFPSAMSGTGTGGNEGRRSGMVDLLPMMEYPHLYDEIMQGDPSTGIPPGGPVPWDRNYKPWQTRVYCLQCPASLADTPDFQATNYAFCIGDVAVDIHQLPQLRGAFAPGLTSTFRDFTDGTANSIALAEMGTIRDRDVPGQYAIDLPPNVLNDPAIALRMVNSNQLTYRSEVALHKYGRGYNWADGAAGPGLVNTILSPNGPSCAVGGSGAVDGIYSAGSYHPGGVQVGMCDGSARFITDKIDCGNTSAAPPKADDYAGKELASPFGVWGALGTINGGELVNNDDY
ncbi:prepilin-type cleavage/methylation domain-containing protein [Blastopirellula marina]|uniref:Prepilin-type cleavage/methylation domain-containing protein n=1 Tax=Blastopirellula marina TaxID=124 RepID=A0A2S8FGW6_9BACT|nr:MULTISPECIES: DUF1559 domain-containing protein [Pirellulaceae]PQO31409.1 prepilin-type cleavage/methylation domain-containing protein [Blastopirellula marina]RCS51803.1 DUF1559 domain-containing protein [Bremerella cremea]